MNNTTKQIIAVVTLAVINFGISSLTASNGRNLAGQVVEAGSAEMRDATVKTLFFGIQLISFILGALFALVPYKGKTYGDKVVPFSLTIAICIHTAFLLMGVVKLF